MGDFEAAISTVQGLIGTKFGNFYAIKNKFDADSTLTKNEKFGYTTYTKNGKRILTMEEKKPSSQVTDRVVWDFRPNKECYDYYVNDSKFCYAGSYDPNNKCMKKTTKGDLCCISFVENGETYRIFDYGNTKGVVDYGDVIYNHGQRMTLGELLGNPEKH